MKRSAEKKARFCAGCFNTEKDNDDCLVNCGFFLKEFQKAYTALGEKLTGGFSVLFFYSFLKIIYFDVDLVINIYIDRKWWVPDDRT